MSRRRRRRAVLWERDCRCGADAPTFGFVSFQLCRRGPARMFLCEERKFMVVEIGDWMSPRWGFWGRAEGYDGDRRWGDDDEGRARQESSVWNCLIRLYGDVLRMDACIRIDLYNLGLDSLKVVYDSSARVQVSSTLVIHKG